MRGVTIISTVTLTGDYDVTRRDELDELLDLHGDDDPLVIDLHEVQTLDTAALRSLVRFQKARREAGKSPLVLAKPSERLRDFLLMARIGDSFDIRD